MAVPFTTRIVPREPPDPPLTATHVETGFVNDTMIVSFAYTDPVPFSDVPKGQSVEAKAYLFVQVAMSRTTFTRWITGAMELMAGMQDRDELGWSRVVDVIEKNPYTTPKQP